MFNVFEVERGECVDGVFGFVEIPRAVGIHANATVSAECLTLRLFRETLATTTLSVLRTAPRSTPPPEAVLLTLVRGGDNVMAQVDGDDEGGEEAGGRAALSDEAAARSAAAMVSNGRCFSL